MGLVVLCVFEQDLVHVGAGVLEQLVGAVEDDQGDLAVAQHAQLVGLLHQAKLSLCKRNLRRGEEERRGEERREGAQGEKSATLSIMMRFRMLDGPLHNAERKKIW